MYKRQDVSGYEENLLLGRYEEGCWKFYFQVHELPVSKSQTEEAKLIASAIRNSYMEVEASVDGFY